MLFKLIYKRASVHSTTKNYFIMKAYQKAEMIAKNLPTGSYAAGCPTGTHGPVSDSATTASGSYRSPGGCAACEVAK